MATKKFTIAILDEEQKERNTFINFFENDFNVVEIPFVSSIDQLIEKIKSENIDAIAIDYKLKEHSKKFKENGDFFFKNLIDRLQEFPALVLTQDVKAAKNESKLIKPRFIVDKKILHSQDEKEKKEFRREIQEEIKIYKNNFKTKLNRLKELQKIKKTAEFTDQLENEYLTLNNEIAMSLTGHATLPLKYFSQETNKKLDEIIAKTDSLIKKVSKKK